MAQVIVFYIPEKYAKKKIAWTPKKEGKLISFPISIRKKSA